LNRQQALVEDGPPNWLIRSSPARQSFALESFFARAALEIESRIPTQLLPNDLQVAYSAYVLEIAVACQKGLAVAYAGNSDNEVR